MGLSGKLKRKDIDQVNDDFSDFSLSSPATKIRRLDADLPPIREEDEPFSDQDKAIVLFNPLLLHHPNNDYESSSPSTLSLSLNSDLISDFKNQFLRASHVKSVDFDEGESEQSKKAGEGCLAIVPWVPSQTPPLESTDGQPEAMEADEMDIEVGNSDSSRGISSSARMEQEHGYYDFGYELSGLKALHHWPQPQQHCMIPHPPQNPFTPITWSQ